MVDIEDSLNLIQVGNKRLAPGTSNYVGPSNPKKGEGTKSHGSKSGSKSKSNMLQSSLDEIKEDAMDSEVDDTL